MKNSLSPLSGFIGKVWLLKATLNTEYTVVFWPLYLLASLAILVGVSKAGSTVFWHHQYQVTDAVEKKRVHPAQLTALIILVSSAPLMSIFRFPPLVWIGIGILIISLGIRQSFGIFMMPISESFHTGREFFSFAIALQNLLFGLFQPFVGMASDRWGSRRIIAFGAVAYAAGLYLTSLASSPGWLYITLGALVGLGLSATSYVIVLGAIARVVPPQHTAKAFGLTTE